MHFPVTLPGLSVAIAEIARSGIIKTKAKKVFRMIFT
jgi:hypothetical protein